MTSKNAKTIAVFGHYGNRNLGDEAITEAMLKNMSRHLPDATFIGMSINPIDTAQRHRIESVAIRRRSDGQHGPFSPEHADSLKQKEKLKQQRILNEQKASKEQEQANQTHQKHNTVDERSEDKVSWKQQLKALPVLGLLLCTCQDFLGSCIAVKSEIFFLVAARRYLKSKKIDLIVVTGSNQFLDNFGGSWGFPYTLLKWTLLAKSCNTKVAYASIGAGPLSLPLSFKMLDMALKRSAYLSYRDDGSKSLVESKILGLDGHIYPDIAHSLDYKIGVKRSHIDEILTIAVNPMPVYDSRYWAIADDEKFYDYVNKLVSLCTDILSKGYRLKLFSTQAKDANVISDIMERLQADKHFIDWRERLHIVNNDTVDSLMETIASAHVIVATRFHATVLPLQLNKPVLGICYYRKAAELLADVGLENYHVDIDNFSAKTLVEMLDQLIENRKEISLSLQGKYQKYAQSLDEQYQQLAALVR